MTQVSFTKTEKNASLQLRSGQAFDSAALRSGELAQWDWIIVAD